MGGGGRGCLENPLSVAICTKGRFYKKKQMAHHFFIVCIINKNSRRSVHQAANHTMFVFEVVFP